MTSDALIRSLRPLAAIGILAAALTGCAPTDPDAPSSPAAPSDGADTGGAVGNEPGAYPVDDAFFDSVDDLRTDFDTWHDEWLRAGCSADLVAQGDINCAGQLIGGGMIATMLQIVFGGTGVDDFASHPQLADLADVRDDADAASTSSTAWGDAACASTVSPACDALTVQAVDDLEQLHGDLLQWSR